MNLLLLFAHPALHKSRVNRVLVEAARAVPGVTVHDLYNAYADLQVDVTAEKELLTQAHTVVLQHPFFWYSSPAILKEWQDLVLQYGWAYGPGGEALVGKRMLSAITTGGTQDAYRREGHNRWTIRQFLAPFEQTALLCGMDYLPPFITHGAGRMSAAGIEARAQEYAALLGRLATGEAVAGEGQYFGRDDDSQGDWQGPPQPGRTEGAQ